MKLLKIYIDSYRGLSPESWMLAVVMLINRAGSMVLPFLGVYMTDHLGFRLEAAGLVLSCFGIGSVCGSWLGGWMTDRFGEFRTQYLSLFLSVPAFCLMPLFTTEFGLAGMIFLQSIISETFRPANSVAITKYAKKANITRSFSLNRMAVNLGFSIGPALGGILSAISYDFLFYSNAAAAFLAGVTYVRFFRNKTGKQKIKTEKKSEKEVSPYRDLQFLKFAALCFLFSMCFFQLLNTLTIFYKLEAGLSQQQIGFVLGYSGIFIVLTEMLLVNLAEKRMRLKITLLLGSVFAGISFAMLGWLYTLPMLFLSITILSIGEIWAFPFMSSVTAIRSGVGNQGAYMGMLGIGFSLSFIITPYLGTFIAQEYGFKILWIATGTLLVLAGMGFYFQIPKLLKDQEGTADLS